jgi:hypothetical protein
LQEQSTASPKPFIEFARNFFECLTTRGCQGGAGKAVKTETNWNKKKLNKELSKVLSGNRVCSAKQFKKSAAPRVTGYGNEYILHHSVPSQDKWSDIRAIIEFIRKEETGYFHVYFEGFKP